MLAEVLRDTLHPKWVRAGAILSTDDLFMVDGEYQFDPTKLGEYHAQNLENATRFHVWESKCRESNLCH